MRRPGGAQRARRGPTRRGGSRTWAARGFLCSTRPAPDRFPERQVPEVPHPKAMPHEDHRLLDGHPLAPEPPVLRLEGPRADGATKHVLGVFFGARRGYRLRDPLLWVVPAHNWPSFPANRCAPFPKAARSYVSTPPPALR